MCLVLAAPAKVALAAFGEFGALEFPALEMMSSHRKLQSRRRLGAELFKPSRRRLSLHACKWLAVEAVGIASVGAIDLGQGSNTVIPQIFAATLGVPVRSLILLGADTDLTPDAGKRERRNHHDC